VLPRGRGISREEIVMDEGYLPIITHAKDDD